MSRIKKQMDPWARLARAILDSGMEAHDMVFLESDWAESLRIMCQIDDRRFSNKAQFDGTKMCKEKRWDNYDDL